MTRISGNAIDDSTASVGPRRIILLVSDMGAGGAERVAASLVEGWVSRGVEVQLVTTYSAQVECEIDVPERVHFTRLADSPGCAGAGVVTYIQRLRRLRAIVRSWKPDVVVSFLTNVNVFVLLATAWLRIPIVVSERVDPASENESSVLLRWLRRMTYPLAAAVVVQTERIAQALSTRVTNLQRIVVIPNPVPGELESFAPVDRRPADGRRVVALGRLSAQKRFDVLISAFSKLADQHREWSLWIWGEGPLRRTLETQLVQLGLSGRAFLPGKTDRPWRELSLADIFALSSDFEGFPNAMLEAMALGIACVATDCQSGPRELSRNGVSALLVEPGNIDAMSVALGNLIKNDDLRRRLGESARQTVYEDCDIRVVLDKWDSLFGTLIR